MPWAELGIRLAVGLVSLSVASFVYANLLLWIGHNCRGIVKLLLAILVYFFMAAVLGAVMLNIFGASSDLTFKKSWPYLAIVIVAWAAAMVPGILYIQSKVAELRGVGFFLPRDSTSAT